MNNLKRFFIGTAAGALMLGSSIVPAFADTYTQNFDGLSSGTINAQDGWSSLGNIGSGCALYDHAVDDALGTSGFGSQSLRISNAVTSGCFGDQTFSKPLTDAVGEADATNGSYSPGTLQPHFEMEFDVASTIPNGQQPGLFVSVSPDRGDGSRMSYIGFEDVEGGINIIFYDVQGTSNPANFVLTNLGTYDRTIPHHIKLTMDVADGASNDVVNIYIDGDLKHTGTSWENYFRFDTEASAEQSPRIVKNVLFRTGGAAAAGTSGSGFLFDNVSLMSGPTPVVTPNTGVITNPASNGDSVSGTTNFTAEYTDNDPDVDPVQWAIRQGTCVANVGTVLGNVDGHSDVATWDGQNFSFSTDVDLLTPGDYCFVFNPTDDPGQNDVRETRNFVVETPPVNPFDVPAQCDQTIAYNLIQGTNGSEVLNGTNGPDMIYARGGSDVVNGRGGNDCIDGGNGSDHLVGGEGDDVILGGAGSDSINGNGGNDKLYGGAGNDAIRGNNGNDQLFGEGGSDSLQGNGGVDTADGGAGSDACSAETEAASCEA